MFYIERLGDHVSGSSGHQALGVQVEELIQVVEGLYTIYHYGHRRRNR